MSESHHGMELQAVPAGERNMYICPGVRNVLPSRESVRKEGSNGGGGERGQWRRLNEMPSTDNHSKGGLSALADTAPEKPRRDP